MGNFQIYQFIMPRLSVILLLFLSVSISCKEKWQGNLVGYIRSLDEFAEFNGDEEGFIVTAMGQRYYTTYTDKDGRFEFSDLPTGTYEISIHKEGYCMMKEFSIRLLGGAPTILHVGSDGIIKYYLYRVPESTITELEVTGNVLNARISHPSVLPEKMKLRIYYSDIQGFNGSEIRRTEIRSLDKNGDLYSGVMDLTNFPFSAGQKIYVRARVLNFQTTGLSSYYDPVSDQDVYPNQGALSEEFSFIFNQQ